MGRIFKGLIGLVILGFAALSIYAYLVDLNPRQEMVTKPLVLHAQ